MTEFQDGLKSIWSSGSSPLGPHPDHYKIMQESPAACNILLNILAQEFGVPVSDIKSSGKKRTELSVSRSIFCMVLSENTAFSGETIGRSIGVDKKSVSRKIYDFDKHLTDKRTRTHYERVLQSFKSQYIPS